MSVVYLSLGILSAPNFDLPYTYTISICQTVPDCKIFELWYEFELTVKPRRVIVKARSLKFYKDKEFMFLQNFLVRLGS
jgi:hypothetical protein